MRRRRSSRWRSGLAIRRVASRSITSRLNVRVDNSALDAKSYSLTGVDTSKPQTSQLTGGFAVQGPLKIPHLLRNGPNIFIDYQRTRNSVAVTTPGLVPDAAERSGNFSQRSECARGSRSWSTTPLRDSRILRTKVPVSPQAQALLNLYPLPNFPATRSTTTRFRWSPIRTGRGELERRARRSDARISSTGTLCSEQHARQLRQPAGLRRRDAHAGYQQHGQLGAYLQRALAHESGVPVQPAVEPGDAVLGESHQRLRAGRHQRQRSGLRPTGDRRAELSPAA